MIDYTPVTHGDETAFLLLLLTDEGIPSPTRHTSSGLY